MSVCLSVCMYVCAHVHSYTYATKILCVCATRYIYKRVIYRCSYVCTYTHICYACGYIYIYTYIHIRTYKYTYVHTRAHMNQRIHADIEDIYKHEHNYDRQYACNCISVYVCVCVFIYIHTSMYVQMFVRTHRCKDVCAHIPNVCVSRHMRTPLQNVRVHAYVQVCFQPNR